MDWNEGPFSVRLSGSSNLCIGRVEIFHRGKWGTVCDDEWDLLDATVVCRELDCGEALSAPHGAWFGEGTGPIWLNEVRCQGTELHLHTCRHKGFRRHVCTHEEDASVICSVQRSPPFTAFSPPPTVKEDNREAVMTTRPRSFVPVEGSPALRLIGGRSRCSGRVEVFHQGQWGTVCDDMWGLSDVAVVCRELGCGEALAAPGSAIFGEGNDVIWLDDVQCQGGESKLTECLTNPWGTHNCRHNEDAGAVCSGQWQVRLAGGSGSCAGRVEVLHEDTWGTVCDDGWDLLDAAVVCRELRCGAPVLSRGNAAYGPGTGPIWLDDVNCTGKESTLQDCQSQPWGLHNCNHHEDASVICTGVWKPLSLPKSATESSAAEPVLTTQEPNPVDESRLQNTLDEAEVPTQGLPPAWETAFPSPWHPDELFLPPTHEMELEVQTEEATSPWDIQKTTPGQEVLPDVHHMESPSPLKTRSLTHTHRPEPTDPSVESQPLSTMWELESERETEPPSPSGTVMLKQGLQGAVETEPFIQWENTSRKPSVPQKAKPCSSSAETQSASAVWVVESARETEPTSSSGTELPSVIKDLKDAMETVTEVQWDNIPGLQPVTQEPTISSAETQPASSMWDLESEAKTDPPSLPGTVTFKQDLQAAVESVPSIHGDNMSQEPPVTQNAEANSSSTEIQPTAAIWVVESERETESTSFSGTELLPDTTVVMETMTQVQRDDIPRMLAVTQEPTNTPAEGHPASAMWVWESESEMESATHGGLELFPSSESLEATKEMEMQTATQNIQPMNNREETSPKVPDSKGDADPKQKEILGKDPHTVRSIGVTESTIVPSASSSWTGTDVSSVNDVLSQGPTLRAFDIDGPSEEDFSSEVTERESETASTPGQPKASGTRTPSPEPAIPPTQPSESSAGCPVRQEPRKEHQDCCCSADTVGNMVHAMDGLHGELGSLTTAIQQQGSHLEAVARSLAELVTSVHQLVGVLPALMQPVPPPPPSVPCRQNEGEIQNQLPGQ
ncbi:UNVERIFIED_CONTAM: hypothetical protein K2H54_030214 [Gekko kuhli]